MTLNDIWRSFKLILSFPCPISGKLYTIRPQKLKLLKRNHTTSFRWYDCRWPWRYFEVIRLFHIEFLKISAWYGKGYYRLLIGNHTLAFDWCHFWWPWMIFEGHFTLKSPISRKSYRILSQKLKLLIVDQTSAFRWYERRWPWRYFKVIKLFHIKFLGNGAAKVTTEY